MADGNEEIVASVDSFKTMDYDGLESYLKKSEAEITIVNFWATWCAPCIKELPYFEQIKEKYKEEDVRMILVSLDFSDQKDRLENFIERQDITSEVILLDDPDANSWIDRVDKTWSGAIPATIIFSDRSRNFYERSFTFRELEKEVLKFIK